MLQQFRLFIVDISTKLTQNDVELISYIQNVPREYSSTAIGTLNYLRQIGLFSHTDMEPLAQLFISVQRRDIVDLIREKNFNESKQK